jgi:hypothetical protein
MWGGYMSKIKIDLDYINDTMWHSLAKRVKFTEKILDDNITCETIYRTNKGYHVRMHTENTYSDASIVALQSILGSDNNRELFNLMRVRAGAKDWNVLFRRKYKDGQLVSREVLDLDAMKKYASEYRQMDEKYNAWKKEQDIITGDNHV